MKICLECATPNKFDARYCYACGELFNDDAVVGRRHHLHSGQVIRDQYKIVRPLGRGGMGAVYLATQTIANRERQVVVKEMLDFHDINDPQGRNKARQRFEAEAATLVTLNIAGVPQIFDYFSEGERSYIVMQFIQGHNLQDGLTHQDDAGQIVPGQPYPVEKVRYWGIQVCRMLKNMASQDVVHMDIKPSNLILDHSGDVWLVDFGTAKAQWTGQASGAVGMQKSSFYGTAGYAPIEQYQQQAEPRSDIYALAATLYHLLADDDPRQHPFEFPKLKQLPADISSALKQALARDVNQRIAAAQFQQLLTARQVTGTAFRWRDGTTSREPEELVEPASRRWVEAREYFGDDSWKQWFQALNRNDVVAQLVQAKALHPQDDVALDAFLRKLDPSIPPPRLELTSLALDFGVVPWQTRKTLDLEIQNVGGGCLFGQFVDLPSWLQIGSDEQLEETEAETGLAGLLSPDQMETAKLTATTPTIATPPADPFTLFEPETVSGSDEPELIAPSISEFATPDQATIKVAVDAGLLSPKVQPYVESLTIKVGADRQTEFQIPVTVIVPKPRLATSPLALNLGAVSRDKVPVGALTVSNQGLSAFEGHVQCPAEWLTFEPAYFRCEPDASVQVAVRADPSRIGLGRHTVPVEVQAQAGTWSQTQEILVKIQLPWLRTFWRRWAPGLDGAAGGVLMTAGMFGLTRSLLGFNLVVAAISILLLVIGGLLAFSFEKIFLVALLILAGAGLGYVADLWLGLAPTVAWAGIGGMLLGIGLRSRTTAVSWRTGLIGLMLLAAVGAGVIYAANQPIYWWHQVGSLRTKSIGVALSLDGARLASTAPGEAIRLWNLNEGASLLTLDRHKDDVTDVVFSPDNSLVASGSEDRTVWLWRVDDGRPLRMLAGHTAEVLSLAFSADGSLLASGTADGTIWLWQANDGLLVQKIAAHAGHVTSLVFAPDGKVLVSGGSDKKVRLWHLPEGTLLKVFTGHAQDVTAITFSSDGALLASGGADRTIWLWSVAECVNTTVIECDSPLQKLVGHRAGVTSVAFSPDGALVASGSDDHNVKLWRVSDGTLLRTLKGSLDTIHKVSFTPHGTLVSTSEDGTARLWWVGE